MIRKTVIAAAAGAVVLAGGAAAVAATTTSSSGVTYHGCERTSNNREIFDVYSTKTPKCPSGAWQITFNQQGRTGATGAQGQAGTPSLYESTVTDAPDVQLDMAPGPDGNSGASGWGWDSTTNKPVTDLTAGSTNSFTVTVLQSGTEQADGSITLSWNPYDFTYEGNSDTSATCVSVPNTSAETCTYTDLAHTAKSDAFQFKANNADPDAVIGVTATVNGEQATGQFPVEISSGS